MSSRLVFLGVAALLALSPAAQAFAQAAPPPPAESDDDAALGGVRLLTLGHDGKEHADPELVGRMVAAAASAGWIDLRERSDSGATFAVPQPYDISQFVALLDALKQLDDPRYGLQLLDKKLRKVDDLDRPAEK